MVRLGDVIDGKYELRRLIGEGGMGAVYEGENTRIHRKVAIKVLHGEISKNHEAVLRFEREAQAAGRIGSEHIIEILDLGDLPNGDRYMVMEFLEGESLGERLSREGPMLPRDIAPIALQVLSGLSAAHQAAIVHRDLKPDNIYLLTQSRGQRDFVKILDFGISKFTGLGPEMSLTRTGAVLGTPYYMAPEQATSSNRIDHRVDIYAAGVLLYQAVSGDVPFDADTFNELLVKLVVESPVPLARKRPEIDQEFIAIVERAMARRPDDRFANADEFSSALQDFLGGRHLPAGRTMKAGTPAWDKTQLPDAIAAPKAGPGTQGGRGPQEGEASPRGAPQGNGTALHHQASRGDPVNGQPPREVSSPGAPALPLKRPPYRALLAGAAVLMVILALSWLRVSVMTSEPERANAESPVQREAREENRRLEQDRKPAPQAPEPAEAEPRAAEQAGAAESANAPTPAGTTPKPPLEKTPTVQQAPPAKVVREREAAPPRAPAPPGTAVAEPAPPPAPAPAKAPQKAPAPAPAPQKAGRAIRVDL